MLTILMAVLILKSTPNTDKMPSDSGSHGGDTRIGTNDVPTRQSGRTDHDETRSDRQLRAEWLESEEG